MKRGFNMPEQYGEIYKNIDKLIDYLDEKDRMQRKVQFLLDIRGNLFVNKIKGDYVELGLYRGEMLYATNKVMKDKFDFNRYIGLDTFQGEPEPRDKDEFYYLHGGKGDLSADISSVSSSLKAAKIKNVHPIKGDFRRKNIQRKFLSMSPKISLACVDCNWHSSSSAALDLCLPNMVQGGVIFVDDYFIGTSVDTTMIELINEKAKEHKVKVVPFKVYAPFAKAFFCFHVSKNKMIENQKNNSNKRILEGEQI